MEAVLQQALQCKLCAVHYDYGEHAPHVMPCGHTACLRCLQQLADSRCSECRQEFNFPLGKNFMCMNIMEVHAKEALTRRLEGVLPPGVQDQCSGEQALQALSLLQRDWELTLRGGERALTGTLRGGEDGDPLAAALCLLAATRTQLREDNLGAHQPAARAPSPTASTPAVVKVEPAEAPLAPLPLAEAPNLAGAGPVPVIQHLRVEDVADLCGGSPSRVGLGQDALRAGVMERIRRHGVGRLNNVRCGGDGMNSLDSSWALALLLSAAPTLEMLHVEGLQDVHLLAIHDMPRLRRLEARFFDADAAPLELPALPPGRRGLQWLSMKDFPPGTALSLVRAHSGTLQALELETGPEAWPPLDQLPYPCGELDKLRRGGGLPALRRLVLLRREGHRSGAFCEAQCHAVQRALGGPTVMCADAECDNVQI